MCRRDCECMGIKKESKKERKRKRSYVCVNAFSLLYVLLNMLQGNQESFVINWKQKHFEVTETKERKKKKTSV